MTYYRNVYVFTWVKKGEKSLIYGNWYEDRESVLRAACHPDYRIIVRLKEPA
jgi:hypothetical protein